MLVVETVGQIRRAYFVQGMAVKAISRDLVIRSEETEFRYRRKEQPLPRLGPWQEMLCELLEENEKCLPRERLTLIRLFEDLRGLG